MLAQSHALSTKGLLCNASVGIIACACSILFFLVEGKREGMREMVHNIFISFLET